MAHTLQNSTLLKKTEQEEGYDQIARLQKEAKQIHIRVKVDTRTDVAMEKARGRRVENLMKHKSAFDSSLHEKLRVFAAKRKLEEDKKCRLLEEEKRSSKQCRIGAKSNMPRNVDTDKVSRVSVDEEATKLKDRKRSLEYAAEESECGAPSRKRSRKVSLESSWETCVRVEDVLVEKVRNPSLDSLFVDSDSDFDEEDGEN